MKNQNPGLTIVPTDPFPRENRISPRIPGSAANASRSVGAETLRRPKSTIFFQGDAADCFYVVKSGWVQQHLLLEDGRRHILDFATCGDIIGVNACPGECHDCTAETITDVILCAYPSRLLCDGGFAAADVNLPAVMAYLARESRRIHKRICIVASLSASERILHLLTDLFLRSRRRLPMAGDALMLPLNQQMIAETIGLTSVHVSRTLSLLRLNNVVDFRNQRLTVMDADAMIRMSHIDPADYAQTPRRQTDRRACI